MTQDILITPGSGEPQILFRGSGTNDTPIELNVLSSYQSATGSGTALIFEGTQGQLFGITDNLSSGVIFSVSDITGLPAIEYDASGDLKLGEYADAVTIYSNNRLILPTGTPGTTTNSLYNVSGVLYFNGSGVSGGGGGISNVVEDTTPQLGGTLDANGNIIDMGTYTITDAKVGQWDTAYGWGDHASAGYLTSETSHADVVVDGDFGSQGIMLRGASAGTYSILTDNSTNWNTAYGWGDHSTAGYLSNVVEDTTPQLGGDLDANSNNIDMGANAVLFDNNIKIGNTATGATNTGITIGFDAGNTSGSDHHVFIGSRAASGAGILDNSVMVGYGAGSTLSAGYKPPNGDKNVGIGYQAFLNGAGNQNIGIGDQAYNEGSGNYNITIGDGAGGLCIGDNNIGIGNGAAYWITGSRNIEIIANGTSPLTTAGTVDDKINIQQTIVGDTSSKLLAIGNVTSSDLTPDATLEIKPNSSTDIGLIVQGAASQSASFFEIQDSSETVVAKVYPTTDTSNFLLQKGAGDSVRITAKTVSPAVNGWAGVEINSDGESYINLDRGGTSDWADIIYWNAGAIKWRVGLEEGQSRYAIYDYVAQNYVLYAPDNGTDVTTDRTWHFNKAAKGALNTESDAATVTFNLDEADTHTVTLGGNRILALSNADVGQRFVIRLVQDGTGSRTVTWFSTIKWPGGLVPTLTTTGGKTDVFGFICTSADNYDGFVIGYNL